MTSKKFFALMLAFVLMLSILPAAALAKTSVHYDNYVALGDSIPSGTGMPGYYRGIDYFLEGTYPAVLKEMVGASDEGSYFGSRCAMRCNEMRIILEEDYRGDDYTVEFFEPEWANPITVDLLKEQRPLYLEKIAGADLITLNFGSNELYGMKTYGERLYLGDGLNEELQRLVAETLELMHTNGIELPTIEKWIMDEVSTGEHDTTISNVSGICYAIRGMIEFRSNWDIIIREIRELNPTATIIAISVYNPNSLRYDPFIELMNDYMVSGSEMRSEYVFCDDTDIAYYIKHGETTDGSHANAYTHRLIAERIYDTLERLNKVCAHEHTMLVHQFEANRVIPGYTGDLVCLDCGEIVQKGTDIRYEYGSIFSFFPTSRVITEAMRLVARLSRVISYSFVDLFC